MTGEPDTSLRTASAVEEADTRPRGPAAATVDRNGHSVADGSTAADGSTPLGGSAAPGGGSTPSAGGAPAAGGASASGNTPAGGSAPAADGDPGAATALPEAPGRGDGWAAIGRLTDVLLPALIARLAASQLGELEVAQAAWRVRLRRQAPERHDGDGADARGGRSGAGATHSAATIRAGTHVGQPGGGSDPRPGGAAARDSARVSATSPAVGYYAPRDSATAGSPVRSGDVVGYVDVLGVRQEVVSPIDGIVARHIAQSGEAVEYGQDLVRVERLSRTAARGSSPAVGPTVDTAIAAPGRTTR